MTKAIGAGMVVLGMAAAPAFAQSQPPAGGSTQSATPRTGSQSSASQTPRRSSGSGDIDFIVKAAQGGIAEVQLGQLASDKGTSDQVKQFGKRMVTDHSKANDELKSLAQSKGITVPSDTDAKHKQDMARLSKLSGAAFDKAFMQHMLADHRKDVNEFKKESTAGKDQDVKQWAGKTLPTLEEHLQMAQDTTKAVGTSGTKTSKKSSGR
jgi:putative membrane protein